LEALPPLSSRLNRFLYWLPLSIISPEFTLAISLSPTIEEPPTIPPSANDPLAAFLIVAIIEAKPAITVAAAAKFAGNGRDIAEDTPLAIIKDTT
jgi:hypothetical protein